MEAYLWSLGKSSIPNKVKKYKWNPRRSKTLEQTRKWTLNQNWVDHVEYVCVICVFRFNMRSAAFLFIFILNKTFKPHYTISLKTFGLPSCSTWTLVGESFEELSWFFSSTVNVGVKRRVGTDDGFECGRDIPSLWKRSNQRMRSGARGNYPSATCPASSQTNP